MQNRHLDAAIDDRAVRCVRCGFCLEACPTFVLTGRETESPRGRIYLARSASEGVLGWSSQVMRHLDTCLGCRACEPACPSGVAYGSILEMARERLERLPLRSGLQKYARIQVIKTLCNAKRLRLGLTLASLCPGRRIPNWVSKLLSGRPAQADKPSREKGTWPVADYPKPTRKVYFLEGCVMRVLFSLTNQATIDLLRRHECEVVMPVSAGCCGALATHAGFAEMGRGMARKLIDSMPGHHPVVTNSAGCGSAMKSYGEWLTDDAKYKDRAESFASRVKDITEFLVEIGFRPPAQSKPRRITYHDACHLAHAQRITSEPRELLRLLPGAELVELHEADRCCGSAGVYNLTEPDFARELLERKWRNVERAGAYIVATGNPGCVAWMQQAAREHGSSIRVVHTAVALAESYLP